MRALGYGLLPAPNISSSAGRAKHRYRRVRGFESRCSLDFIYLFIYLFFQAKKQLFKLLRTPKIIPLILKKEWIKNTHKWYKRERNIKDEYTIQNNLQYWISLLAWMYPYTARMYRTYTVGSYLFWDDKFTHLQIKFVDSCTPRSQDWGTEGLIYHLTSISTRKRIICEQRCTRISCYVGNKSKEGHREGWFKM